MVLYLANPRESMIKLILTRKVFTKVEGYKMSTEKSVAFIYTNNNQLEDIIIEKPLLILATKITYFNKEPNRKCEKKFMQGKL